MKAIVVMVAKEPVPGRVKTRLCPHLRPDQAAQLYMQFVFDMVEELSGIAEQSVGSPAGPAPVTTLALAYTPESAEPAFRALVPASLLLFPQHGNDLGERLAGIFEQLCAEGYDQVHVVNSDSPDIPRSVVESSIRLLAEPHTDLVLGPCHDGGYFLIGLKEPAPKLFEEIPWSTDQVLEKTLERARALDFSFALLEPWYDIDIYADVVHFLARNTGEGGGGHGRGRHTRRYLENLKLPLEKATDDQHHHPRQK